MLESGSAPSVELATLDGDSFSLAEHLKHGPIVLAFFKISCPTCQFTLPFLGRLYDAQFPGSPCVFGISQDKPEHTREFNNQFGIHFPVLLDSANDGYPVSNAYGLTNVPSLFLIGTDGRIEWSLKGFHRVELNELGKRFGRSPFEAGEKIPLLRPG